MRRQQRRTTEKSEAAWMGGRMGGGRRRESKDADDGFKWDGSSFWPSLGGGQWHSAN
jgi:hypothetical protein